VGGWTLNQTTGASDVDSLAAKVRSQSAIVSSLPTGSISACPTDGEFDARQQFVVALHAQDRRTCYDGLAGACADLDDRAADFDTERKLAGALLRDVGRGLEHADELACADETGFGRRETCFSGLQIAIGNRLVLGVQAARALERGSQRGKLRLAAREVGAGRGEACRHVAAFEGRKARFDGAEHGRRRDRVAGGGPLRACGGAQRAGQARAQFEGTCGISDERAERFSRGSCLRPRRRRGLDVPVRALRVVDEHHDVAACVDREGRLVLFAGVALRRLVFG
jgi:hypothetical protein